MADERVDDLPWSRLDRTAKPIAARLSTLLPGITYQHGIGGLVEFWDLCGDVRELERLVASGRDSVVLSAEDLERKFELGMGRPLRADLLEGLGLAERLPDGSYRVRGMSRYIEPIKRRLEARESASNAGKASVSARRVRNGTAQPPPNGRSNAARTETDSVRTAVRDDDGVASEPRSGAVRTAVRTAPERNAVSVREPFERPPNQEVRGKRKDRSIAGNETFTLEPTPAKERKESEAEEWFEVCVENERRVKLLEEGGSGFEVVPLREVEKGLSVPYINAQVKRLREAAKLSLFPETEGQLTLSTVWGAYVDDPSNAGRDPPYSFRYFCHENVFHKYLEKVGS